MKRLYFAFVLAGALVHPPGTAAQTITQDQALRMAFPAPIKIERRTAYLSASQLARAQQMAGVDVTQRVVTYYVGMQDGGEVGTAYFDGHRVRTLGEVLMLVVNPEWKIDRIEVLRFAEPPEYRAPSSWLGQFRHKQLSHDLSLKRAIVPMTGATLTANAVTNAARRTLALHAIIQSSSRSK